jgi:hypothetical protein
MLARGGLVISRRLKTRKALVLPITEGESCSVFAALNQGRVNREIFYIDKNFSLKIALKIRNFFQK